MFLSYTLQFLVFAAQVFGSSQQPGLEGFRVYFGFRGFSPSQPLTDIGSLL